MQWFSGQSWYDLEVHYRVDNDPDMKSVVTRSSVGVVEGVYNDLQ